MLYPARIVRFVPRLVGFGTLVSGLALSTSLSFFVSCACAYVYNSVVARNNSILKKLVLEAKRDYEKDAEHRVHIFMADQYVFFYCYPLLCLDSHFLIRRFF